MQCKSYSHFFCQNFQHICVSLDVNFNESLTNDVVSFEQLGPGASSFLTEHTQEKALMRIASDGRFPPERVEPPREHIDTAYHAYSRAGI